MSLAGSESLADGRVIRWTFGSAANGNMSTSAPEDGLDDRRQRQQPGPWLWLRQVHGADVVDCTGASFRTADIASVVGTSADGSVTDRQGLVLAVQTADCCPVLLWSDEGIIGAVHAGWRGLVGGAIEATAERMRVAGASSIAGRLGPCICERCYEFGEADLDAAAGRFGHDVIGTTSWGTGALDVRAAVSLACADAGVSLAVAPVPCTAHDPSYFSHRARGDLGRQSSTICLVGSSGG